MKTDAKDAIHLARLLRLDEIAAVVVPSIEQEAARDLVRAREDCRGDLMRARHRLSKLLLRQGIVYNSGHAWTAKHDAWLRRQHFDLAATQWAFESNHDTVLSVAARRERLDVAITAMAADSQFTPLVRRLGCLKGNSTLTALRAHGRNRRLPPVHRQHDRLVHRAGSLRALLRRHPGPGLDHQDRQHPRPQRLLVEAAWHHRSRYRPGNTMRDRWDLATPARARGDAGNRRLNARWNSFTARRKKPVIANVAIARELAGWRWSLAVIDEKNTPRAGFRRTRPETAARGATHVSALSSRPLGAGDARS